MCGHGTVFLLWLGQKHGFMRKALMDKKSSPNTPPTDKKRKKITQSYLENAGVYYLQRFSASTAQFRRVMERKIALSCKDHPDQEKPTCLALLDRVVQKFENLGYLNDTHYANALLHSLEQRGLSHSRIQMTLRQKGISIDLLDTMMPDRDIEKDKLAALRWAKKKRLGPFSTRTRDNDLNRGLSSLARAGFDYDLAHWVMKLSPDEAAHLL